MNVNKKNMEEDRKYKELEEENNRLKAEIKKLGENIKN
jgi:cell division protein FtsB